VDYDLRAWGDRSSISAAYTEGQAIGPVKVAAIMVARLRSLAVVTVGCLIVATVALVQFQRVPAAPSPTKASISPHRSGPRIWYPARAYPTLLLPNGQHEVVHSVLNISEPVHYGSFVWDEDGIPKGPLWVRIDLGKQVLSVFRAGHEIGFAVILYGANLKQTPTGTFRILQKDADHYSHSYDAPMPYMLRLTNDGVAIHGSNVREGWATHGCIGVPLDFARLLFSAARKDDLVIILPAQPAVGKA
jgi:hypothetical protein